MKWQSWRSWSTSCLVPAYIPAQPISAHHLKHCPVWYCLFAVWGAYFKYMSIANAKMKRIKKFMGLWSLKLSEFSSIILIRFLKQQNDACFISCSANIGLCRFSLVYVESRCHLGHEF